MEKTICVKVSHRRKRVVLVLIILLGFWCQQACADTLTPQNWSPTWVNPAWDRPANMVLDRQISVPGDIELTQILDPVTCSGCHSDIYNQWQGSMHGLAQQDPVYQAAAKLFLAEAQASGDTGAIEEARSCVRCHTPVGHLSKTIETSDGNFNSFSADDQRDGIFCDFCHTVKASAGIGNAPFIVDPGKNNPTPGTKWGPRGDAPPTGTHDREFSELHTRSEMCGMCHDVTHTLNGTPLERTYTEWRESPYNTGDPSTTVYCQDCHMRQKPGVPATGSTARPDNPGQSSPAGPERPHIYVHYVVGGNAAVSSNETIKQMAVERLQNCAEVEIEAPDSLEAFTATSIKVRVTNTGAGHYLPTGLSEVRQMWLHVIVESSRGEILFESGRVDTEGTIDPNARMYNIVLADKNGNHTANVALADHVESDNRIPPKGCTTETFTMGLPVKALRGITITATLKYRSASQSLINTLLEGAAPTLPIIDMASATKSVQR